MGAGKLWWSCKRLKKRCLIWVNSSLSLRCFLSAVHGARVLHTRAHMCPLSDRAPQRGRTDPWGTPQLPAGEASRSWNHWEKGTAELQQTSCWECDVEALKKWFALNLSCYIWVNQAKKSTIKGVCALYSVLGRLLANVIPILITDYMI